MNIGIWHWPISCSFFCTKKKTFWQVWTIFYLDKRFCDIFFQGIFIYWESYSRIELFLFCWFLIVSFSVLQLFQGFALRLGYESQEYLMLILLDLHTENYHWDYFLSPRLVFSKFLYFQQHWKMLGLCCFKLHIYQIILEKKTTKNANKNTKKKQQKKKQKRLIKV